MKRSFYWIGISAALGAGILENASAQVQVPALIVGPDETVSDPASVPADCSIAASDDYVGIAVNQRVEFYERVQGFPLLDSTPLPSFFSIGSGFDPRIAWDSTYDAGLQDNRDQFLISFLDSNSEALFGWSAQDDVDPLLGASSPWESLSIPTTLLDHQCDPTDPEDLEDLWIDQPALGLDHRAWYVAGPSVGHVLEQDADQINNFIHIIRKDPTGAPSDVIRVLSDQFLGPNDTPLGCFTAEGIGGLEGREVAIPAIHHGEPIAGYLVGIGARALPDGGDPRPCGDGEFNVLRLYAIGDPLDEGPPQVGGAAARFELEYYELVVPCFDAENVNTPDASIRTFRGGDGRISSASYVDLAGGRLIACHSVREFVTLEKFPPPPGGTPVAEQKRVRWYVVDLNGWPDTGEPTLSDWGEIDGGVVDIGGEGEIDERPVHLIYPAIAANELGDFGLVMNQTSAAEPISIQATGKWEFDGDEEPLVQVDVSTDLGPHSTNKWGDYNGVAFDPLIDGSFWGFASVMETAGPGGNLEPEWTTRLFRFELPPP